MRRATALSFLLAAVLLAAFAAFLVPWLDRSEPVEPPRDVGEGAGGGAGGRETGTPPAATVEAGDAAGRTGLRTVEGHVLGAGARPVEGALVEVVPGPSGPGPASAAPVRTLADGAFLLQGVPAAAVRLRARHPAMMDGEVALAPGATEATITLTPALVAWFRVRPKDGKAPEGVVGTAVSGRFRRTQGLVAPGAGDPEPPEPGLLGPLKVPTDTGAETLFQVEVPGYLPWSIDDDAPATGATRVYDVGLVRPPEAGRVRVRLRAEGGETLPFASSAVAARIERLDGPPGPRTPPRDVAGDLVFDRVAPGRYRVTVLARGRAPATTDVEVKGDEETVAQAAFGTEARARIRVLGNAGKPLLLRLTRDDRPAPGFLDPAPAGDAGADPWGPTFSAGEDGVVVAGLAPGPYVVEVISPDLAPVGARFDARAGETVEVEVRPSAR